MGVLIVGERVAGFDAEIDLVELLVLDPPAKFTIGQRNALAFLRNSDGQQQQRIERLKQSRITLTHILLFAILLCAGSAIALDVDKAFSFHKRLNHIEHRLYP